MVKHLKKIIPLVLITILAAVGVETFYRVTFTRLMPTSPSPKVQAAAVVPQAAAPNPDKGQKRPDREVILKRNLFGPPPGTKSAKTAEPAPDKLAATSLELSLQGTIAGPPNKRRAIILDKKKKVQDIYYQGDTLQGAVIKEIQRGKIILSVNGKDEILVPETPKASPTTAPGPEIFPQVPAETVQEDSPDMPAEAVMEPQPIEPPEPTDSTVGPRKTGIIKAPKNRFP